MREKRGVVDVEAEEERLQNTRIRHSNYDIEEQLQRIWPV